MYEFSHNKIHIKGCKSSWGILKTTQASNCVWESFKIKLTRNKPSIKIQYRYVDETGTIKENNYLKDGINIIPKSYNLKEGNNNAILEIFGFTTFYTDPNFECTIELLPEYPGALVFDGVDDYISLDAFDSGFKTIFMVCTFFSPDLFIYDQRNNTIDNENALTTNNGEPCYYGRNRSGITYINGLLNDYKPGLENSIYPVNTKGKKHLITCAFINGVNTTTPIIANRYDKGYQYLKMNLYKFLGFKEALTEEQIQAVIKKYNLLNGVDEIEVS